jgi:hypothetical protein
MNSLKKFYLNLILWAVPAPAALGWRISQAGDFVLETSGKLGMDALRGLGRLESEGR